MYYVDKDNPNSLGEVLKRTEEGLNQGFGEGANWAVIVIVIVIIIATVIIATVIF